MLGDDMRRIADAVEKFLAERPIPTPRQNRSERPETPISPVGTVVGQPGTPPGTLVDEALTPPERVRQHLAEHPEDRALSIRDLAAKVGVGKSTVSRVLKDL